MGENVHALEHTIISILSIRKKHNRTHQTIWLPFAATEHLLMDQPLLWLINNVRSRLTWWRFCCNLCYLLANRNKLDYLTAIPLEHMFCICFYSPSTLSHSSKTWKMTRLHIFHAELSRSIGFFLAWSLSFAFDVTLFAPMKQRAQMKRHSRFIFRKFSAKKETLASYWHGRSLFSLFCCWSLAISCSSYGFPLDPMNAIDCNEIYLHHKCGANVRNSIANGAAVIVVRKRKSSSQCTKFKRAKLFHKSLASLISLHSMKPKGNTKSQWDEHAEYVRHSKMVFNELTTFVW